MLELYVVLIIVGILTLGAEIYIPGGVLGVLGIISLIGAVIVGYRVEAFQPYGGTISAAIILVSLAGGFFFWLRYFPTSPVGRRLSLADDGSKFRGDNLRLSTLKDAEGEAVTALRPAGEAQFNGERVDVVADGSFIEKGSRIRVINISGNRVVVSKID